MIRSEVNATHIMTTIYHHTQHIPQKARHQKLRRTWQINCKRLSRLHALSLRHEGLSAELRGSDLLCDSSRFALLHVGVADLV